MDQVFESVDAWQGILRQLRAMTGDLCDEVRRATSVDYRLSPPGCRAEKSTCASYANAADTCQAANVRIVEWSEKNLIIVWHDPTACSYDDQRWRRAKSDRAGICALTGMAIHRGQEIYKPARSKPVPANAGAMILVSALPVVLADAGRFECTDNKIS